MKSTFNKENKKGSNRYDYFDDDEDFTVNENIKNRSTEMNESIDGDSKSKYLSDFFNKLQNKYTSGAVLAKEDKEQEEKEKLTNLLEIKNIEDESQIECTSGLNKDMLIMKIENKSTDGHFENDFAKSIDKSLNKTNSGNINFTQLNENKNNNNNNISNDNSPLLNDSPNHPQIEEDKKAFLIDLGLCDTDLLNAETNGLHTPQEIDYFSSNENSDHSNFDISRMSNFTQRDDKNKSKVLNSKGVIACGDKNSKNKISKDKLAIGRDFDTNIGDILAVNKNNLRKSMNCLPSKLTGKAANKAKTIKSLAISVKKLQDIKKFNLNTPNDKIIKQSSRGSYNPAITESSYAREKTPTTASTKKEEKTKPKIEIIQTKNPKLGNNSNLYKKSPNHMHKNTNSDKDTLNLDNLQTNKSIKIVPRGKKSQNVPINSSLILKSDGRNRTNSQAINDSTYNQNASIVNQFLYSNQDEEIDFNSNKMLPNWRDAHQYDDLITELEGIFGENLENFNEEILFSTLEDFDSKILIRSLIFLSFEQKKLIKNMKSEIIDVKEQLKEKFQAKDREKTETKLSARQMKYSDRSDFLSRPLYKDMYESKSFLPSDKSNTKSYYSKMQTNDPSRLNVNESRIISQSKVFHGRSSSVIGKLPPKKSMVMNTKFMEGVIGVKKNIRTPFNKYI